VTEVRAARAEEWRDVRDLRLRALADAPHAFGSTLEREREYGEREWLGWISGWDESTNRLAVGIQEEAWVGMAVGSRTGEDELGHVYGMWVDPRARRAGLGRRLLVDVTTWLRSLGASEIELGVTATNRGALAFYERMGFVDTKERRPLREDSALEVIVMRRRLRRPR
jgi:ribosomal protein S18 acetylase RimI-like enzyme